MILFLIIAIMTICTYIIPAGSYERVYSETADRTVVDPNSFQYVDPTPVSFFDFLNAIPEGMVEVADIMVFIFVVGGSFNIITQTGAMENGIKKLAYKLQGREKLIIPIMMFVFSLGGATFGMSEETIIFIPIGIALARALGYDAIAGMAMITFGAAIGFSAGFLNPFTVGVAQKIAELPTFSGMPLRIAVWVCMLVAVPLMILRYANKVKRDPEASYVRDLELAQKDNAVLTIEDTKLSGRDVLVLLVVVAGLAVIVFGVMQFGWGVLDIASVFSCAWASWAASWAAPAPTRWPATSSPAPRTSPWAPSSWASPGASWWSCPTARSWTPSSTPWPPSSPDCPRRWPPRACWWSSASSTSSSPPAPVRPPPPCPS